MCKMELIGIIGGSQRMEIIMGDVSLLAQWKGADADHFENAHNYLEDQELEDGVFPFQNGEVLLLDTAASVCGVFQNVEQTMVSIVSFFPKKDLEDTLKINFVADCPYAPSRNAAKLCTITYYENSQIIWNSIEPFKEENLLKNDKTHYSTGVETKLLEGKYDVWGEELDVSHKWGLAAIRIRIVPKGQGILVGEILK